MTVFFKYSTVGKISQYFTTTNNMFSYYYTGKYCVYYMVNMAYGAYGTQWKFWTYLFPYTMLLGIHILSWLHSSLYNLPVFCLIQWLSSYFGYLNMGHRVWVSWLCHHPDIIIFLNLIFPISENALDSCNGSCWSSTKCNCYIIFYKSYHPCLLKVELGLTEE